MSAILVLLAMLPEGLAMNLSTSKDFRLFSQTGKLFAIARAALCAIASFAWLLWQSPSEAQNPTKPPEQLQQSPVSKRCLGRDARPVLVEFIARGEDWGNVWLDGRNLFSARNFNRRYRLNLCPRGYRVIITGVTKYDVWASGYLDVGKTNVIRVAFSKNGGVEVSGDPSAWLPDNENDPMEIWQQ